MARKTSSPRWPSRPRPTPRGIAGKKITVYIDAIVQRHVPLARIDRCIKDHQRGTRVAVVSPRWKEPVFKTECTHEGFTWWAVSFPLQRRLFLGPPEFFGGMIH